MNAERPWLVKLTLAGFAIAIMIPSLAVIHKYSGIAGILAYLCITTLTLIMVYRFLIFKFLSELSENKIYWLAGATLIFLVVVFLFLYPIANSGVLGGGSDSDEALNIATSELLKGHYPYYQRTYLGNRISPMPGSLVLAIPFVLMGNSAYQNIFWLAVFFFIMRSILNNGRSALLFIWTVVVLSPSVLHMLAIGSDYIANSLFVFIFMYWLIDSVPKADGSVFTKIIFATFLGIGLSSRANFIFLLPLIFSMISLRSGWTTAVIYVGISIITLFAITIPFYLYDPQGFSPLHTSGKLGQFESMVPHAGIVIPVITGVISLALSFLSMNRNLDIFLINCGIVLAFPVLCGIILSSIQVGRLDLSYTLFGMFFLFFFASGFWIMLVRSGNPKKVSI